MVKKAIHGISPRHFQVTPFDTAEEKTIIIHIRHFVTVVFHFTNQTSLTM